MRSSPRRTKTRKAIILAVLAVIILAAGYGVLRLYQRHAFDADAVKVPILMYHSVTDDEAKASRYTVTAEVFRADMEYLKENGYTAIFVSELAGYINGKGELPAKPVIVTFDDGYKDNYTLVYPILKELDMKADISVVGSFCDGGAPHLSWGEVREMAASGLVEIGNHTFDMHQNVAGGRRGCRKMPEETPEEYQAALRADLTACQTDAEENAGLVPPLFTYPYGKISAQSTEAIENMGFCAALTTKFGTNYIVRDQSQLFDLHRFNRPSGISTESFMKLIK